MTRRNPLWRLLALIFALTLIAAACGDDDDDTSAGTTTTAPSGDGDGDGSSGGGDGTLTIGTLLPETGSLAFLGPPEFAGVDLAIQEINEAGGVLGNDVEVVHGDSGDTSTDIANQTVDRLLGEGADAIIGAASSGVTLTVIDKITGAGVLQVSPANTAKSLSEYDDDGLYFRTAPSDILQGQVLGEVIIEDGNQTVGILALQDPYGEGLAEDVTAAITDAGGEVVETRIYDPNAQNFDAEVEAMVNADPEAILVIGFDESARILSTMIEKGVGPGDKNVYGTDGNMGNPLGEQLASSPGALEGMKGTTPLVELSDDFKSRLDAINPNLDDTYNYAAESYDAVIVVALAAIAAGSDDPTAIAAEMINVSGPGGTQCSTFQECADLLADGEEIDYEGVSGPIDFNDVGDPGQASFGILVFNAENRIETLEYRVAGA